MTTSKVSDKINANELAELFGLTTYDDLHEHNIDYIWEAGNYAYKEALDDDASEEEAEEARDKAEQEADRELFENWHSALMNAARRVPLPRARAHPRASARRRRLPLRVPRGS
jgi:hypothetical protein